MLVFIALNRLALAYQSVGNYNEAIKTYEESLERCHDGNLVGKLKSTYMESCTSYYFSNSTC